MSAPRWPATKRKNFSASDYDRVRAIAAGYSLDVIEYDRDGDAILISSGCGIMMAVMDEVPRIKWCVDIDRTGCDARLRDFIQWAHYFLCMPVFIVGWFSITDPDPLRSLVISIRGDAIAYTPSVELGAKHVETLAEFVEIARN